MVRPAVGVIKWYAMVRLAYHWYVATKMTPVKGLMANIKYWARGSLVAVVQLVLALIYHFNIQEQVAAELGKTSDEKNSYIVLLKWSR